jgi:hypothetical protein
MGMKLADQITGLLAILALVAVGLTVWGIMNYQEGMNAVQSFQLDLTEVQLSENDEEVRLAFRAANQAPIDITMSYFHFSLYLNGNFMGSNYTPFTGQELASFQEEQLEFIIPLRPFYAQYIEQARANDSFSWSIRGGTRVYLPPYDHEVNLNVRQSWSTDDE